MSSVLVSSLLRTSSCIVAVPWCSVRRLPCTRTPVRASTAFVRWHSTVSPFEKQRTFLLGLPGGSVDLAKNEDTGIATVMINNPERKNALSGQMMVQLADIVTDLESWKDGRGVVLRGTDEAFCSGADLKLMKTIMTPEEGGEMSHLMQDTLTRFFCLPLVTLAFVEGNALGGGAELCAACDFRALARNASVGFIHSKRGVSVGWGGGVRLVHLLGRTKALRLLATAAVLSSQEALDVGLADYLVDSGSSGMEQVARIMHQLTSSAANPTVLQAAKKVVLNATSAEDLLKKIDGERTIFQAVWGGPAQHAALDGNLKFFSGKS